MKKNLSARYVKDLDTVNLVEGALNMEEKIVGDIMTPLNEVYAIPHDMILDEKNVLDIYRRGHSHVPVYQNTTATDDNGRRIVGGSEGFRGAIFGVFKVKKMIVTNHTECRCLNTMPTITPCCVSPNMNIFNYFVIYLL